jgi:hypothetical protein
MLIDVTPSLNKFQEQSAIDYFSGGARANAGDVLTLRRSQGAPLEFLRETPELVGSLCGFHGPDPIHVQPVQISSGPDLNQLLSLSWKNSLGQRLQQAWVDWIPTKFDPEWLCHLTFKNCLHPEQADKYWFRWVNIINHGVYGKRYKEGVPWLRGKEWQKRGAIHFHAIIGGGVRVLSRMYYKELWYAKYGNARIYEYDPKKGGLEYITKYIAKGGELDLYVPGKGIYHSLMF